MCATKYTSLEDCTFRIFVVAFWLELLPSAKNLQHARWLKSILKQALHLLNFATISLLFIVAFVSPLWEIPEIAALVAMLGAN